MTHEEWRDVVGYEGYYQVSDQGRVRGVNRLRKTHTGKLTTRVNGRILHPTLVKNGYLVVRLSREGKGCNMLVHRIVAQAFLPNPENKRCVDHINADRTDNRLENLRWVTHSENNENMLRLGRGVDWQDRKFTKLSKDALEGKSRIPVVRSDGKYYMSIVDAAHDLGYKTSSAVSKTIHKLTPNARGYTFRYATEEEILNSGCVKVLQIDPQTNEILRYFDSSTIAVKEVGNTGIRNCLAGRNKLAGGYRWEYGTIEDIERGRYD